MSKRTLFLVTDESDGDCSTSIEVGASRRMLRVYVTIEQDEFGALDSMTAMLTVAEAERVRDALSRAIESVREVEP